MEEKDQEIESAIQELQAQDLDDSLNEPIEGTDAPEEVQALPTDKEYTEFEKEQLAKGWDPTKEKTAEQWSRDGEWINKLKDQQEAHLKELGHIKNEVKNLVDYNRRIEQKATLTARQQLMAEMQRAKEEYDVDRVEALSKEIQKVSSNPAETLPPEARAEYERFRQADLDFRKRNIKWYNEFNEDLKNESGFVANSLLQTNPELRLNPEELAFRTEQEMARRHPDRCKMETSPANLPPRTLAASSDAKSEFRTGDRKYAEIFNSLPVENKKVFRLMQKTDAKYSVKEYVQQLQKYGEI